MNVATTIRDYFENYLKSNRLTLHQFSQLSGINSGTLSGTLSGQRPIGVQQLDRLTVGMGLPEGHFYDLYINESFANANPDWRRLGPFLYRCAELNQIESIKETISLVMDNLTYAPHLFDLAEQLFSEGKLEAARPLYYSVAESEKMQHSERLALSQYRLFTIGLSNNQQTNQSLATQFELFVDRLDEMYQLDGLNDLINVYSSLRNWSKLLELSDKLKIRAEIHYKLYGRHKDDSVKKEIVFYVLYADLVKGSAYSYLGDYVNALKYVEQYSNQTWIKSPNEAELIVMNQFNEWAEANRYLYELMSGNVDVLESYLEYISERKNEIFPALCAIVSAANRHNMNIDSVLEQYESYFTYQEQENKIGKVSTHYTRDQYGSLLAGLGTYYLTNRNYDKGMEYLQRGLDFAMNSGNKDAMLDCLGLFGELRDSPNGEGNSTKAAILLEKISERFSHPS
ncbi:transcriptional regulator [Paenibacillus tundrae]